MAMRVCTDSGHRPPHADYCGRAFIRFGRAVMATTRTVFMVSCVFLANISSPAVVSAQSDLTDRVAAAVESVEAACAVDIAKFCSTVTRGGGRVLACMQAHDDQLNRRCQFAVYRA